MKIRSLFVGVAATLCAASLAGCTSGHDLPTISGAPTGGSGLETAAKSYYDCMSDAGIEVKLMTNNQDQVVVVQFTGDHEYMWRNPAGDSGYIPGPDDRQALQPDTPQAMNDFDNLPGSGPYLWVDRTDLSSTYAQCLSLSEYSDRAAWGSDQVDTAMFQRQVDGNNKWAACARENGWPDIKDSVMPTGLANSEYPMVLLPTTITEDQLRALLDACPNFDPDKQKMLDDWWASYSGPSTGPQEYPPGYLPDPAIGFDTDMTSIVLPATTPTGNTPEDHLARLYSILTQRQMDYYQQQPSGTPT